MSNSPKFFCRHPDCEGTMIGSFKTMFQRNVHLEQDHRKERDPIQDPTQLFEEIKKLKNRLHNEKWRGDRDKTYTLLYTNPKRAKVKQMRKELLKEIYDLQDDLEWICNSHFMLYYSGSQHKPGIHFPREINDLDWERPDGVVEKLICSETNKKATEICSQKKEIFLKGKGPVEVCDKHATPLSRFRKD